MCVVMQQSAVVHLCCVHCHTWISHAVEAASSQTCTQCATSTNSWQPWLNGCCHVTEHGVHCHHQLAQAGLRGVHMQWSCGKMHHSDVARRLDIFPQGCMSTAAIISSAAGLQCGNCRGCKPCHLVCILLRHMGWTSV
jgi:hypothetical protein